VSCLVLQVSQLPQLLLQGLTVKLQRIHLQCTHTHNKSNSSMMSTH